MNIPTEITSLKEERIISIGNQFILFQNWNPKYYKFCQFQIKEEIKTILLMSLINSTNKPNHFDSQFWKLSKEILFLLFQFLLDRKPKKPKEIVTREEKSLREDNKGFGRNLFFIFSFE